MSTTDQKQDWKDAFYGQGPANLWNAPSKTQQDYNAAFAAEKARQQK